MNGRVYDPFLARMISADPTVPGPFNGQAFNRYSYVLNSPLSLTDPSGFSPAVGICGGTPRCFPAADGAGGHDFGMGMPVDFCPGFSNGMCGSAFAFQPMPSPDDYGFDDGTTELEAMPVFGHGIAPSVSDNEMIDETTAYGTSTTSTLGAMNNRGMLLGFTVGFSGGLATWNGGRHVGLAISNDGEFFGQWDFGVVYTEEEFGNDLSFDASKKWLVGGRFEGELVGLQSTLQDANGAMYSSLDVDAYTSGISEFYSGPELTGARAGGSMRGGVGMSFGTGTSNFTISTYSVRDLASGITSWSASAHSWAVSWTTAGMCFAGGGC